MKNKGIIVYGTADDRLRLAAIVALEQTRSGSSWLLEQIRERYRQLYGDMPPDQALDQ